MSMTPAVYPPLTAPMVGASTATFGREAIMPATHHAPKVPERRNLAALLYDILRSAADTASGGRNGSLYALNHLTQ